MEATAHDSSVASPIADGAHDPSAVQAPDANTGAPDNLGGGLGCACDAAVTLRPTGLPIGLIALAAVAFIARRRG
jgi:hypothetical protein